MQCTCKPRIDSRVSAPCLLWLLLILAVCFPRLLLFSRASLESVWPLRRCTIVRTPLKVASHLPFHRIPVKAKSIFSREQDSSTFGESSWKQRSESWGKSWARIFYQFLVLAIVKVEKISPANGNWNRPPVSWTKTFVKCYENLSTTKTRVRDNLQLNESKSFNFRDTSSAVPCKMTARPIGRLVIWTFVMAKDIWEIKNSKFMMQTQQRAMTRHQPCCAKRQQSQSESLLNELFMIGKELWETISSKSHRYIVNVLLKSVRVFRAKFL